jgi:hypothetical protein
MVRSKMPWRRKCMPLLLHGPHHRRNIPFVEQYRKSGVFDFLGCCFRYCRGISLLSRQSPEIYRHVMKVLARRLRRYQ